MLEGISALCDWKTLDPYYSEVAQLIPVLGWATAQAHRTEVSPLGADQLGADFGRSSQEVKGRKGPSQS